MYCFSQICRVCLCEYSPTFKNLCSLDHDKIRINDKLKYCVPEIIFDNQLPENVCKNCRRFLRQMYTFKRMCINNTNILHNYASRMSEGIKSEHNYKSDLFVAMNQIKKDHEIQEEIQENTVQKSDEKSVFSISLNQWDLFETKFTCKCIKEYSSFTEDTQHLCKNCEGELLGFRLSKVKVNVAENRYNKSLTQTEIENEDNNSDFSQTDNLNNSYEKGFDYNDILLCKVHVNGVNRQIIDLTNENIELDRENFDLKNENFELKNENIEFDCENHDLKYEENDLTHEDILLEENNLTKIETELQEQKPKLSRIKTKLKPYSCPVCLKRFTRRYNLNNHYSSYHGDKEFYYCKYCRIKFVTKQELEKHELKHRRLSINQRPTTTKSSPNKSSLKKSSPNKSSLKKSSSNKSSLKTSSPKKSSSKKPSPKKSSLSKSFLDYEAKYQNFISKVNFDNTTPNISLPNIKPDLNSSDENLICNTCDKIFDHKSNLAIHLLTHVGKHEFKCEECGKQFFREENYKKHMNLHKIGRKYKCDQCDKSYNYKSNLRRHQYIHGGKYLCSICNEQFVKRDVLEKHIFAQHIKPDKTFTCQECNMTFTHADQLKTHVIFAHPNSHHVNFPKRAQTKLYSCKICLRTFNNKGNLYRHKVAHKRKELLEKIEKTSGEKSKVKIKKEKVENPKRVVKSIAKKRRLAENVKKDDLSKYVVESNGIRAYYCPICERTYSIKTNIKSHILTHSNRKILKCAICSKKFTNMFLLRQHIKTHPEDLLFKCKDCGKVYLTKSNLQRHIDTVHGN